jgi:hypothetical protein
MYLPSINKVDTSQRVVAITFDDGPTWKLKWFLSSINVLS